jgi:hypothetical protein
MVESEFRDLCREVSLALNAESPDALFEEHRIEIADDVEAALYFSEDLDPDTVFCYVDLGDIAQEQRADVYQNLLELNLITGSKTNAVFALDPASGRALLVAHLPARQKPEASLVVQKLRLYAQQAQSMRGTLLTGAIPTVAPGAGAPPSSLVNRA